MEEIRKRTYGKVRLYKAKFCSLVEDGINQDGSINWLDVWEYDEDV